MLGIRVKTEGLERAVKAIAYVEEFAALGSLIGVACKRDPAAAWVSAFPETL